MISTNNTNAKFNRHNAAILTVAKYSGVELSKMIVQLEKRLSA